MTLGLEVCSKEDNRLADMDLHTVWMLPDVATAIFCLPDCTTFLQSAGAGVGWGGIQHGILLFLVTA